MRQHDSEQSCPQAFLKGGWITLYISAAAGTHVLDEAERSLHDALCVLSTATADSRVLYGGGWPEMQVHSCL